MAVGDLHPDETDPMLVEKSSPAGHIHFIQLCRDGKTGFSLGFAQISIHQVDGNTNHTKHYFHLREDPVLQGSVLLLFHYFEINIHVA